MASQTLIYPRFVRFHDGIGKSFLFLVTKADESEDGSLNQLSGVVWCDDGDNNVGLSEGTWTPQVQVGRSDDSQPLPGGASWSPFPEGEPQ